MDCKITSIYREWSGPNRRAVERSTTEWLNGQSTHKWYRRMRFKSLFLKEKKSRDLNLFPLRALVSNPKRRAEYLPQKEASTW